MRRKWRFRFKLWWLRLLHILPAALLGLGLFYWVVTSSWFIRYAILPRLSQVTGMPLSARSVELQLFSGKVALLDFSAGSPDEGIVFCQGDFLSGEICYRNLLHGQIAIDNIQTTNADVRITIPVGETESPEAPPHPEFGVPSLLLTRMSATGSRLQLAWEHQQSGRRFELVMRDIEATMDQLTNGGTSSLHFTCQPRYQDGFLEFGGRRGRGDWKLEFDHRLYLLNTDWVSELESGIGRFGPVAWPASQAKCRVRFDGEKWNFTELDAIGETPETAASTLHLAGSLSMDGFEITAGSRATFAPATLREWFGTDAGTVHAEMSAEGSGSYAKPAGKINFQWQRDGELVQGDERLPLPPAALTGRLGVAFDRDAQRVTLDDTELTATFRTPEELLRFTIPEDHPVGFDWRQRVFTNAGGQVRVALRQLAVAELNPVIPLPPGWRLAGGRISGDVALETLAANTPEVGATGEIAIRNLYWESPAGASEAGDLTATLELIGAENQWKFPQWHITYRRNDRDLLALDGQADWNVQSRAVNFQLSAPTLDTELVPEARREALREWLRRLQVEHISGAAGGSFRPGRLQLDQLELHSAYLHLALQSHEFVVGNEWDTTRWDLQIADWPLPEGAGKLSGDALLEWRREYLHWTGALALSGVKFRDIDFGDSHWQCGGSVDGKRKLLEINELQWDGGQLGSGSAASFGFAWETRQLLQPLQLTWQGLHSEIIHPELAQGTVDGKAEIRLLPERCQSDIALTTSLPFFWQREPFTAWPLTPRVGLHLNWDFATAELDARIAVEQTETLPNAPDCRFRSTLKWDRDTRSGHGEFDIASLHLPIYPAVALQDSQLQWQLRPDFLSLKGSFWGTLSDYWRGNMQFGLEKTPEQLTVSDCRGEITTTAAEPALIWQGQLTHSFTAPEQTTIQLAVKKLDLPLFVSPEESDVPPTAAASDSEPPAPPWQFDFGSRHWQCDWSIADFTPLPGVSSSLSGHAEATGDTAKLTTTKWSFNGAPLQLTALLRNIPQDYPEFAIQLSGSDINTAPFWQSWYQPNTINSGIIRQLEIDLAGAAAPAPRFWDELSGYATARVESVNIENRFQQNPLGKILFLPLEGYLRARAMLPGGSGGWLPQLSEWNQEFLSLYHNTSRFSFDRGNIHITSADGVIAVEQFELYGSDIDRLLFSGSVGCGTRQQLNLDSTIDFQGLIVPLKLVGTLEDPQIQWDQTTLRLFSDNALSWSTRLLDTGLQLFNTGTRLFSRKTP